MVMTLKSSYRCIMASPKARALRSNSSGAMGMISATIRAWNPSLRNLTDVAQDALFHLLRGKVGEGDGEDVFEVMRLFSHRQHAR